MSKTLKETFDELRCAITDLGEAMVGTSLWRSFVWLDRKLLAVIEWFYYKLKKEDRDDDGFR